MPKLNGRPKNKRWVKKGTTTEGWNKTGRTRIVRLLGFHKTMSAFPESLRTTVRCRTLYSTGDVTGIALSYYANSCGNGSVGSSGCGPQVNYSGAYATSYPLGLTSLIANPIVALGAKAPYYYYIVYKSRIHVKATLDAITTLTAPSNFLTIQILPSAKASYLGMAASTFAEQPNCKEFSLANPISGGAAGAATGANLSTVVPVFHNGVEFTPKKILGVPDNIVRYNNQYWNWAAGAASYLGYYHVNLVGDGNTFSANVEVVIEYDIHCFDRNQLSSQVIV